MNDLCLMDRINIVVRNQGNTSKKQQMFVIYVYEGPKECISITVRKIQQIDYLIEDMNQKYGGHIIPVLELSNTFKNNISKDVETMVVKIGQYLNQLIKNHYCNRDIKLYQFIFLQQVHFPNMERYDKVLSDAAIYSRRYLNSIFTRKTENNSLKNAQLLGVYLQFKQFSSNFKSLSSFIDNNAEQYNIIEQITSNLTQIRGSVGVSLAPISYYDQKLSKQAKKLQKLIFQGEQAYLRWQVLSQAVKQLQCSILKGLHEQHAYYNKKNEQLQLWTKSLILDLKKLMKEGEQLIQKLSIYFYKCKKQQVLGNSQVNSLKFINSQN